MQQEKIEKGDVVIIGGLLVDDIAIPLENLRPQSSNPVKWQHRLGGVAANVAQVVAQQLNTVFIASTGDDEHGKLLAALLAKAAVSASLVVWTDRRSDRYTAVLDTNGELYIGLADAQLAEQTSWLDVQSRLPASTPSAVILDANLSAECIEDTIAGCVSQYAEKPLLIALAVSPVKARRLLPVAGNIDVLMCNRREAAALCDMAWDSSIDQLADGLLAKQFKRFGITDGHQAVLVQDKTKRSLIDVPPMSIDNSVNGAGDALAGATVIGMVKGFALQDAVASYGLPAARAVLSGEAEPPTV